MQNPFGKPARLGSVIGRLVRQKGIAETSALDELQTLWKNTAGERIAAKSFVKRFRSGILEVTVSNGAILEELTCYLKHDLLQSLQAENHQPEIKALKFVKSR